MLSQHTENDVMVHVLGAAEERSDEAAPRTVGDRSTESRACHLKIKLNCSP
jgi:hypothetical protein